MEPNANRPPAKHARILGSVSIVSAMTSVSRVFGLVREVLMAHFFGTTAVQSAFVIAFRIPNLFRRLFGEGALSVAFIPVFTEVERNEGVVRAQRFVARILGMMVCVIGLILGLVIAASFGVERWCPEESRWVEAMPLLRIMLPYAVLICMAAILSGVLNVHKRFAISSLTPVVLNLVWIAVLLGVCAVLPETSPWRIRAVCWGILAAGLLQILFLLPTLHRLGYRFRLDFTGWRTSPYIRQVLLQMGPASLGIALAQINICIDGLLAFYGAEWAPSALSYAERLIDLPLGLLGTAFGTVLLPTYTRQFADGETDAMTATMARALRNLIVIMTPIALGLFVLAGPIVAVVYQRGAFNADSALWTTRALVAYAAGALVFSLNKAIVPAFYAQKDVRTPVRVASGCIVGNFTLNLLSVLLLPEGWRHVGIALSTVLNSTAQTAILFLILRHRRQTPALRPLLHSFGKALAAAGIMCAALYLLVAYGANWSCFLLLPLASALAIAVYFPLVALLDKTALNEAFEDLPVLKKFRRKRPA